MGHSLFEMLFTRIHSTPEQAPFLVARSNPDVAKHLGLVPHCHLIMAFLRNKSIFNSAPGFLGHIWFSWVAGGAAVGSCRAVPGETGPEEPH